MDVARSCLLVLFALGCLAVPSHAMIGSASKARASERINAQMERGTLRITGNERGNAITLRLRRRAHGTLEVDVGRAGRAEFRFRRKAFRRIVLRGGGGSDSLRVSNQNGSFTGTERTTVEGGRGSDVLAFVGSSRGESLTVAASGRQLRFTGAAAPATASAALPIAAGSVEHVDIDPRGGPDAVTVGDLTGSRVADVALELGSEAGGDGQYDTVIVSGTAANDTLSAEGRATRVLTGLPWAFGTAHFEAGADRLIVNGGGGADVLNLSGSDAPDTVDLSASDGLARADFGGTEIESDDVEGLRLVPLNGADTIAVDDLAGTDVGQATLDLASTANGPAVGETDNVTLNATAAADAISLTGGPGLLTATGLHTGLALTGTESTDDRLSVNGSSGNDRLDASGVGAGAIFLTLNGDADNDTLRGGGGADTLNGGDGDDEIFAGPGDLFDGGAGSNTIHQP